MDTFDRVTSYEDVREFFEAHKDRLFRYLVHKRMFTPYEMANQYMDQSCYESNYYHRGYIREIVILPDEDVLLGIADILESDADLHDEYRSMKYYRLSEIRLEYFPKDADEFAEEQ